MDMKIKTADFGCHINKNTFSNDRIHHQNHCLHNNINNKSNNYKDTNGLYLLTKDRVVPVGNSISKKDTISTNILTSSIKSNQLSSLSSSSTSSCITSIINGGSTVKQVLLNNNSSNNGSSSNNSNVHTIIPSDILDDLASRFIINVPDDERNNLIRICFQIELAHWFYLDFFCSIEDKKLMPCGMKQFALLLFQHIPFLRAHLSGIDKILEDWKEYKLSVPTYGAILVSEDLKHVLLVQSYWAKSSWGFPKGKVNEHEDPVHCAAREVFEETGYDISNLIVPNDYIEAVINYQYTRLYLVRNVPLETIFSPRTRKEIKCIEWFPVDALPTNKNDITSKQNLGINANSFFMIMPFIKRLKKWVQDNRCGINSNNHNNHSSCNELSSTIAMITTTTTGTTAIGKVQPLLTSSTDTNTSISTVDIDSIKTSNNNNNNISSSFVITSSTAVGNKKKDSKNSQNLVSDGINISSSNNNNSNNSALNNKNNYKVNNYIIPYSKRQRHKSMGDIDGIKVNFNVYNSNGYHNISNNNENSSKYYNGTKLNGMHMNTPSKTTTKVGETIINGSSLSFPNNILFNYGNKREKYKMNSCKRQILNNNHTNTDTNGINNNNNYNCSNYTNNSNINIDYNLNNKCSNNIKSQFLQSQFIKKQKNNFNESNKIDTNTKLPNNIQNGIQNKYPKKVNKKQQNSNTPAVGDADATVTTITTTITTNTGNVDTTVNYNHLLSVTQSPNLKTLTINGTNNSDILNTQHNTNENEKLGSNFDSWTSFTFTKNFISNVFC